jgi:hypothetical protein
MSTTFGNLHGTGVLEESREDKKVDFNGGIMYWVNKKKRQ